LYYNNIHTFHIGLSEIGGGVMSKNVLENKVVIVTGAGSGLGKETALLLGNEGAKVVACDRFAHKIEVLKRECERYQGKVLALTADVSKEDQVKALVDQTLSVFGRIDILINNAAVFENFLIADTTIDSWNYQLTNNLTSAFLMSRECIPQMRKQRAGKIINISSSLAKSGGAGFGAYSASKAALETFSYTLDEEESQNGIVVNIVNPGVMKTDMQTTGVDPAYVARKLLRFVAEHDRHAGKVIDLD
jgi:3-oxoacyl-[acyl-carrier protein] reductase